VSLGVLGFIHHSDMGAGFVRGCVEEGCCLPPLPLPLPLGVYICECQFLRLPHSQVLAPMLGFQRPFLCQRTRTQHTSQTTHHAPAHPLTYPACPPSP
jgi:hypothetical protein